MPNNSLYFLDVYMPNEGEPETALEAAVLRYAPSEGRPSVYLHTLLKPKVPNRVRWSNAYYYFDQKIKRDDILKRPDLPTLDELLSRDFLKDKSVVCFNPGIEPYRSLVKNAHAVYSILESWLDVYANDEHASKLLKPAQMLEHIGLPCENKSNTSYTKLLCELQSLTAIWSVLESIKRDRQMRRPGKPLQHSSGVAFTQTWPLPDVESGYFEEAARARSFTDIRPKVLRSIFSDALPDYLEWTQISVYSHDWLFYRRQLPNVSHLGSRINSMADLIFNRVLDMNMKFWVLIYYSIYNKKTEYAQEIALKDGQFAQLSTAIKDDFSVFIISHLDDFLDSRQRQTLLKSIIHQVMGEQARSTFEHYDYDALFKENKVHRNDSPILFKSAKPNGSNIRCFKEIRRKDSGEVLYRRYEISGSDKDRGQCIEYVNELFRQFMREVQDPFAKVWTPDILRQWVMYITGFTWQELTSDQIVPGSNTQLEAARQLLRSMIEDESRPWKQELRSCLIQVVNAINQNVDAAYHYQFTFQGISVEVDVQQRQKPSFFSRLFNL